MNRVAEQPVELAIVIVHYRTPGLLIDCLESVLPEIAGSTAAVLVVDNHSADGSSARIEEWIRDRDASTQVRLISAAENGGFAAGNNMGIRAVRAQNYLLLNSDTIIRPGAIRLLLETAREHPEAGLVSPRLESQDGTGQVSCFRFHRPPSELVDAAQTGLISQRLCRYVVPMSVQTQCCRPEWTSFACVLIRSQVFEQVGLLDAGYFMYFEDVEFCRRARRAGWDIVHNPEPRVCHLVGSTSLGIAKTMKKGRLPRYYYESRTRYYHQWYGWWGLTAANLLWWMGRLVASARQLGGRADKAETERKWLDIWTNWLAPGRSCTAPDRPGQ